MRVICSWCKKDLGVKEPKEDHSISHGMCDACLEKMKKEIREYHARKAA